MTEESSGGRIVSRRGVLKITGTAAAFSLAGCSGSGGSSESTFTIGALHPLSGDAAEMGTRFQDVVGAGVQAVNQGADLSPLAGAEGEGIQGQDGATVEGRFGRRTQRGREPGSGRGRGYAHGLFLQRFDAGGQSGRGT